MFKRLSFRAPVAAVAAGLLAASQLASAEVSVTAITEAGTSVGVVGAAVFAVIVGAKLFKWIRRAL
jgi:hypothetical protein